MLKLGGARLATGKNFFTVYLSFLLGYKWYGCKEADLWWSALIKVINLLNALFVIEQCHNDDGSALLIIAATIAVFRIRKMQKL